MIGKNKTITFFLTVIFIFTSAGLAYLGIFSSQAQSKKELEDQKRQIEREIAMINQLLEENEQTEAVNLNQLVIIRNRIEKREQLINSIKEEINLINGQIRKQEREIKKIEEQIEILKEGYARLVVYAYKNKNSYQRIMFLFASEDFNQAYMRLKYFQLLTEHRRLQAEKIEQTRRELESNVAQLRRQKIQQQALLADERKEIDILNREKEQQTQKIAELRENEEQLKKQLQQQEKTANELQDAIQKIIEEERRKAQQARNKTGEEFGLTPEEQQLSDDFAENKGSLPWPTERGLITSFFGEHPHPVLPGIKITNNGIDISTTQGSDAKSIFDGTITRITSIAGFNSVVIIRHGDYRSVYANLSEVYVSTGDTVKTGQAIGQIATDQYSSKTFIHLEIWYQTNKLDPVTWISAPLP